MKEDDKEMIRTWRNSPHVAQFAYNDHFVSREEHERWFHWAMKEPTRRYWIASFRDRDVGLAYLYNINPQNRWCSWAFYLGPIDTFGLGLGGFIENEVLRFVFDSLSCNKLCAEVLATNRAVLQLHKNFGFSEEGCSREHVWKGGQFIDVIFLGILRHEWDKRRPVIEENLVKIAEFLKRSAA